MLQQATMNGQQGAQRELPKLTLQQGGEADADDEQEDEEEEEEEEEAPPPPPRSTEA